MGRPLLPRLEAASVSRLTFTDSRLGPLGSTDTGPGLFLVRPTLALLAVSDEKMFDSSLTPSTAASVWLVSSLS